MLTHGRHILAWAEAIAPQCLYHPPEGLGALMHLQGTERVTPSPTVPPVPRDPALAGGTAALGIDGQQ